jgi:hypothetical protein
MCIRYGCEISPILILVPIFYLTKKQKYNKQWLYQVEPESLNLIHYYNIFFMIIILNFLVYAFKIILLFLFYFTLFYLFTQLFIFLA